MTQINAISSSTSRWRSPTAALIGGGVLLISLGAGAGWVLHGRQAIAPPPAQAVAPDPAAQLAQAPTAAGRGSAHDEVAPQRETAPPAAARDEQPAKAAPQPVPARRSAPRAADTAQGSGTETAKATCASCGVVVSVTEVQRKGEATGLGAVAGGVLGGVLGHQMGGGHGKQAMTVIGTVGGGLAGHEIEKRARGDTVYQVHVRMDDGTARTVTVNSRPANGARVVVEGSSLRVVS